MTSSRRPVSLSGPEAGVYVVGRVVSPVYAASEEDEFGRWKVDVAYDAFIEPPLLRAGLTDPVREPVLADWAPFRGLQETNFLVPAAVAARLDQLLAGRLRPIPKHPGQGFDETAHAIDTAVKRHDARLREQMLEALKSIPPAAFEALVGALLERLGYEGAEVRGQSGDGGVDVYAVLRLHGMTSVPTIIQAKRWTKRNVDGGDVRELRGALHVDEHGVVITTGSFTQDARTEADAPGKAPIGLVDGPTLVDLLINEGIGVQTRSVPVRKLDLRALLDDSTG